MEQLTELMATTSGACIVTVICAFLLVNIVLWLVLPFAVFGIKDKLDKQIKINERIKRNAKNNERTRSTRQAVSFTVRTKT